MAPEAHCGLAIAARQAIVLFVGPQGSDMTNVGIGECEHDDQGIYVLSQCG